MTFENNKYLVKTTILTYMAFVFSLPLLSGEFRSSVLFYLSFTLLLVTLLSHKILRERIFSQREFNTGIILLASFLVWFSLSNLWGSDPSNILSTLKHSLYLLGFVLLFRLSCLHGHKNIVLSLFFLATVILCVLIFIYVDKANIISGRLDRVLINQPSNVIDLGGYFSLSIICGFILIRDTGKKWIFLPIALLFLGLLFTQSRGPLFSLLLACTPLLTLLRRTHLSYLLMGALTIGVLALILFLSNYDNTLTARLASTYQQSFIRIGIWRDAWDLFLQKPWMGWGFDKELDFVNQIGERVHTTHSIYFGTLLKGGSLGMALMLSVVGYSLYMGWQHIKINQALEASMIVFSLIFYTSQGMFILGNPGESWFLFWFPIAVVLSLPVKGQPAPDRP